MDDTNYFSDMSSGGFLGNSASGIFDFDSRAASSFVGGAIGSYFGQKNAKKDAKRNWRYYKKQAEFDYRMADGPYFQLAKKYDEKNYNLARRYSENSASWARTSLEKAGLNPILAASQGFNANMGFQGQQVDSPSASIPSFRSSTAVNSIGGDFGGFIRDMASARLSESSAALNRANMDKVEAETANTLVDAITTAESRGLHGNIGGLVGMLNAALSSVTGTTGSEMLDSVLDKVTRNFDKVAPPNQSPSERKVWKQKAGRFLSDIIKEERSKHSRIDTHKNVISPSYNEGFRAIPLLFGH